MACAQVRGDEAGQGPAGAGGRLLLPPGAGPGGQGWLLAQDGGPLPAIHARPFLAQHLSLPGITLPPSR